MVPRMKRLLPVLVLATSVCAGQKADQLHETPASEAESSIRALSSKFGQLLSPTPKEQQLRAACKVNCAQVVDELDSINAERLAAMDAVASQIHAAVDRYVTRTVSPKTLGSARPRVESGLKHILASAADMQPAAFGLNAAGGYTLIVAYSLQEGGMMGPGGTPVTLRAYRAKGNRVELVDATGSDMDGYGGVSVKVLRSPVLGEAWFLASGNMTGANGPNVRMRVYACNSGKFRTMWMPGECMGNVHCKSIGRRSVHHSRALLSRGQKEVRNLCVGARRAVPRTSGNRRVPADMSLSRSVPRFQRARNSTIPLDGPIEQYCAPTPAAGTSR